MQTISLSTTGFARNWRTTIYVLPVSQVETAACEFRCVEEDGSTVLSKVLEGYDPWEESPALRVARALNLLKPAPRKVSSVGIRSSDPMAFEVEVVKSMPALTGGKSFRAPLLQLTCSVSDGGGYASYRTGTTNFDEHFRVPLCDQFGLSSVIHVLVNFPGRSHGLEYVPRFKDIPSLHAPGQALQTIDMADVPRQAREAFRQYLVFLGRSAVAGDPNRAYLMDWLSFVFA